MSTPNFAIPFAETTIHWAEEKLQLNQIEIGQVVGANRKTVQRWLKGQSAPSRSHRMRLEQLSQLRHLLDNSFRSPEAAARWFHTPLPDFKGRTPYGLLINGEVNEVIRVLATLEAGAFR